MSSALKLPETSPLVLYETMCRAIQAAHKVDEIATIRHKARQIEAAARVARAHEWEDKAREIRIRAERKCGKLLLRGNAQRAERGRPTKMSEEATLSDLGISRDQSSDWQKLAAVPDHTFEQALSEPGSKPSTYGIIARHEAETRGPPPKDKVDPQALWLWGRLQDFEREGLLGIKDPSTLLKTMLPHQRETTERLAPLVAAWLARMRPP